MERQIALKYAAELFPSHANYAKECAKSELPQVRGAAKAYQAVINETADLILRAVAEIDAARETNAANCPIENLHHYAPEIRGT